MASFVTITKPSPATDIVDQNCFVPCIAANYVLQQLAQCCAIFQGDSTLARLGVGFHYHAGVLRRIFLDCRFLVLNRILLTVIGHAHVLRHGNKTGHGLCDRLLYGHRNSRVTWFLSSACPISAVACKDRNPPVLHPCCSTSATRPQSNSGEAQAVMRSGRANRTP